MAASIDLDDEGEALWRLATEAWDDQGRHDRFVHHCFTQRRLAAAARRYRDRRGPDGASSHEVARRMLARIELLAMQSLVPSPRPSARGFTRSPWFLAIIAVGIAIGAALGMIYGRR